MRGDSGMVGRAMLRLYGSDDLFPDAPPDDNGVVLDDQWSGGGELGVTLRRGRYDAEATPEFGRETLLDYQSKLVQGEVTLDRGEQAVF